MPARHKLDSRHTYCLGMPSELVFDDSTLLTQLVSVFNDLVNLYQIPRGHVPMSVAVLAAVLVIASMNPFGGATGMEIHDLVAALAVFGGNGPIGWGRVSKVKTTGSSSLPASTQQLGAHCRQGSSWAVRRMLASPNGPPMEERPIFRVLFQFRLRSRLVFSRASCTVYCCAFASGLARGVSPPT